MTSYPRLMGSLLFEWIIEMLHLPQISYPASLTYMINQSDVVSVLHEGIAGLCLS